MKRKITKILPVALALTLFTPITTHARVDTNNTFETTLEAGTNTIACVYSNTDTPPEIVFESDEAVYTTLEEYNEEKIIPRYVEGHSELSVYFFQITLGQNTDFDVTVSGVSNNNKINEVIIETIGASGEKTLLSYTDSSKSTYHLNDIQKVASDQFSSLYESKELKINDTKDIEEIQEALEDSATLYSSVTIEEEGPNRAKQITLLVVVAIPIVGYLVYRSKKKKKEKIKEQKKEIAEKENEKYEEQKSMENDVLDKLFEDSAADYIDEGYQGEIFKMEQEELSVEETYKYVYDSSDDFEENEESASNEESKMDAIYRRLGKKPAEKTHQKPKAKYDFEIEDDLTIKDSGDHPEDPTVDTKDFSEEVFF